QWHRGVAPGCRASVGSAEPGQWVGWIMPESPGQHAGQRTVYPTIHKNPAALRRRPHLIDYAATRSAFTWDTARAALAGLPGGGLNIAYEAVDRYALGARAGHQALRWLGNDGR